MMEMSLVQLTVMGSEPLTDFLKELHLVCLSDLQMAMLKVVLMEKGLAHLMVNCLVFLMVKCSEQPTELPTEMRLGSLLDDVMVTLMVMMMEMHSAHLTAHQLVQLLEILANIVFCPHHLSETNNIVQCHNFL